MKVKIMQRSVYHKYAEVEIEVPNLIDEESEVHQYLIDNEDRNKGTRIKKILEKYPGCNHIKYWEDKDKHIDSVTETLKEYPNIKLEVVKTI